METALGSGEKKLQAVEKELANYRRSIYTVKALKVGDRITKDNTKILRRPGVSDKGIKPVNYEKILERRVKRNLPAFTLLKERDVD